MEIYIAWAERNEWEESPFNLGVFSSEEKAKKAIINFLIKEDKLFSSLKTPSLEEYEKYKNDFDKEYCFGVETHILDEYEEYEYY